MSESGEAQNQAHEIATTEQLHPKVEEASPPRPSLLGMAPAIGAGVLQKKLMRRRAEGREGGEQLQLKAGNREDVPSGSENTIAEHGFSGSRGSLPYQGEMESGFKRSFGGVEVHTGPEARAASEALGAEAYAVGNKVAFKSENPAKEVVAHELAHTVQQSGGSAGVRTFAATSPDLLEHEADAAAATVVAGGTADIKLRTDGGSGVHKWSGSDHYAIGNLGGQKALAMFQAAFPDAKNGPKTMERDVVHGGRGGPGGMETEKGDTIAIQTGEDSQISMGEASRFGGDYASTPDKLRGRNQEGGTKANWNPLDWRHTAETSAMVMTAATNSNHFYPLNRMEWAGHHAQAIALAQQGNMTAAMQQEGFAVHFLQDTFAAGHMAPRSLDSIPHMMGNTDWIASDAREGLSRSKTWHDFFCMLPTGLPTTRGRFHGDNYMDGNDLEVVSNTVADSLLEVLSAGQGEKISRGVQGQVPAPDLGAILADPVAGPGWRLMQDAYRGDFEKGQKKIKSGMTSTTDGGTSYDSKAVLDEIGQNVMGEGQKAPALGGAAAVKTKKAALVGSLTNINHYVTATWDANKFLQQDDELHGANPTTPHFKLQDLQKNFHLFSTATTQTDELLAALTDYQRTAKGDSKGQVDQEIAAVQKLKEKVANWQKLVEDAGSWLTWRASTIKGYRDTIERESAWAMITLNGFVDLPTEEQKGEEDVLKASGGGK